MSLFDIFKGTPKSVQMCGLTLAQVPRSKDEIRNLADKITEHLGSFLTTEQAIYWYIMEQYDQIRSFKADVSVSLEQLPFGLMPIEYQGKKSEESYVGKPNPGLAYINNIVKPDMLKYYPPNMVEMMIATVYTVYCNWRRDVIQELRIKYALHFQNAYLSRGERNIAEGWSNVLKTIGGVERSIPEPTASATCGITLCGVKLEKMPETQEEQLRMMARAAIGLMQQMPTEQDVYWFVIEQYDRIKSCGALVAAIMATYPFEMFEIEYFDRKSENSYVGHKNPGIAYVLSHILPDLVTHYGPVNAQSMLAYIFGTYLNAHAADIQALRLKYAVHYHNNCVSTGSWGYADQWSEVIDSLDK